MLGEALRVGVDPLQIKVFRKFILAAVKIDVRGVKTLKQHALCL